MGESRLWLSGGLLEGARAGWPLGDDSALQRDTGQLERMQW